VHDAPEEEQGERPAGGNREGAVVLGRARVFENLHGDKLPHVTMSAPPPEDASRDPEQGAEDRARSLGFLKRLWPRLRPHLGKILAVGVLILFSTAIGLVFPLIVQELLDAAFQDADAAFVNGVALFLVGLFAIQGFLNFGQSYLTALVAERVAAYDAALVLVHNKPGDDADDEYADYKVPDDLMW